MAYCKNCGNPITEGTAICMNCGASQNTAPAAADNGGFWWGALGCCVPIVGLILFLVWKDNKPKTAKAAGIGALVSVIASVVFYVVYFVIIAAAGSLAAIYG